MFKPALFSLLIFFFLPAFSQNQKNETTFSLYQQIAKSKPDTNRLQLQLELADYYLNKIQTSQSDYDSAKILIETATALSYRQPSAKWVNTCLEHKAIFFFMRDELDSGKRLRTEVLNYYKKAGNDNMLAKTWSDMGRSIAMVSTNPISLEEKFNCFEQSRLIYGLLRDTFNETLTLMNIADVHLNQGKLNLAEKELLQVLEQCKAFHYPKIYYIFYLLSAVSRLKGNLQKELYYRMEVIKGMIAARDSTDADLYYSRLAQTYSELNMYNESLTYYYKAFNYTKAADDYIDMYAHMYEIVKVLTIQSKGEQALSFLKKTIKETPPANIYQVYMMNKGFARCYLSSFQYPKAEHYFLEMIASSDTCYKLGYTPIETYIQDYKDISEFFMLDRQFDKANSYLQKVFTVPKDLVNPLTASKIHLLQFQIDSAQANYISAIRHFETYKKMTDSIFNVTRSQQIEDLQIKYETSQKDKDIILLKKQAQIDQDRYEKRRIIVNLTLIALSLLMIMLGILYNRYRLKQRNIKLLEEKQKEISFKNLALERLLRENEWLLREVHHRVKNNLHLIMSLLNSQSKFLKDDIALSAILDSQHRVHSMSLIHQKLYKSDNTSGIYMPEYINELVDYLKEGYKTGLKVLFTLDVTPLFLDAIYAIPLGLILNEAITNSIKYAFPHSENDKITVHLSMAAGGDVCLKISDNGRGLPAAFDIDHTDSFGMILIKGLVEDLGGTFSFESLEGTSLSLYFNVTKTADNEFSLHGNQS